jgi:hypothetical protein
MFIVAINLWTTDHEDYYDFEYSGIEHSTREDAEKELEQAKVENAFNDSVESIFIREV